MTALNMERPPLWLIWIGVAILLAGVFVPVGVAL